MHILIVKRGALGDVVRTSYFCRPLKEKFGHRLRIAWLTAPSALPLLRYNPWIDDLWTSFEDASFSFDQIFSLDDERDALEGVAALRASRITGAFVDSKGRLAYSDDAAQWFDMGLLSRFGKARADQLKKVNCLTHSQIFERIFDVKLVAPNFYGNVNLEKWAAGWLHNRIINIGINPFAGERWPSKEVNVEELQRLITHLLRFSVHTEVPIHITLIGAGPDLRRNRALVAEICDARVRAAETDDSVLRLAALVGKLDYLITSDSLAMHLAIAQRVPFLAFFSPTSAAEIDSFGLGRKMTSLSPDYCSYCKHADNSTITAGRLFDMFREHVATLRSMERFRAA